MALIPNIHDSFLVINGDVLTNLNYKEMWDYHKNSNADATIGVYQKKVNIDLGVLEISQDNQITHYIEKPQLTYTVSMGVYIFRPRVLDYIIPGNYLDLPNLIHKLLRDNRRVNAYHFQGYWLDIGRIDDYQDAVQIFETHKQLFLVP